jgi:pyruvate formate lyase activating enzyme
MPSDPVGIVYDIQGFSVQDGPGIRTTVFLKGCPLHCPWCHSPESQRFDIQLSWQSRKCIGTEACGECLTCCPHGAIGLGDISRPAVTVDWNKCDDCGICAEQCPAGALSMWGKRYTVREVVDRVLRDRPFFEKSGGGVTISGGEPLSQFRFTLGLLKAFKEEGLHTALDTTGYAPGDIIELALPYVDLFLLDLKNMDGSAHKAVVGVPNERILENARRIAAAGGKMQIRIPVIPRFNDSGENFRALGRFVDELGEAVTVVQLLPYHAMGVPKWERIKHDGSILEAVAPSDRKIGELRAILEEYGLTIQVH